MATVTLAPLGRNRFRGGRSKPRSDRPLLRNAVTPTLSARPAAASSTAGQFCRGWVVRELLARSARRVPLPHQDSMARLARNLSMVSEFNPTARYRGTARRKSFGVLAGLAITATLACMRPPNPGPNGPAVQQANSAAQPRHPVSEITQDTLCRMASYWVEYRTAGMDSKRLTDSLERARGLAIVTRGYRAGAEVGFEASLSPRFADTLRAHPAVSAVRRSSFWCERVTPPTYLSAREGPPSSVQRFPVELRALPSGSIIDPWTSELDSLRAVVRSASDWRSLWPAATPRYPVPRVDFAREMILVAAAGERGGHGRTIRVDSAFVARDTLFVVVREYKGGRRCITTGMVVRPMHAVRVGRSDGAVVFIDRSVAERECR